MPEFGRHAWVRHIAGQFVNGGFADAEARKKDIPIVQLNPGGTLNHKYTGETAVRDSGLPYSVLRSTGMLSIASHGGADAPGHQHFQVHWELCLLSPLYIKWLLRLYIKCMWI